MKIKILKSQWELLKTSGLEQLSPDDMKFLQKFPKPMINEILKEIKAKSPSDTEIRQFIDNLKKIDKEVTDRTPAPSIDKLNQMIEQAKTVNPQDPIIQYLEEARQNVYEMNKMVSEEDKYGTQKAIDSILDQFKQGKITKEQLEQSLKEFAKRNKVKFVISKQENWFTKASSQEQEEQEEQEEQKEKQYVAKTILEQLGGNKFVVMTGAKNFINWGNGLSFKLPGAEFAKQGINYVKITLDPSDTYTMEFGRTRGSEYKVINTHNNIYFDVLQEVFTRETGLETHL